MHYYMIKACSAEGSGGDVCGLQPLRSQQTDDPQPHARSPEVKTPKKQLKITAALVFAVVFVNWAEARLIDSLVVVLEMRKLTG